MHERQTGASIIILALAAVLAAPALAGDPADDADVERILREGRVVSSREIGTGITRPLQLELELAGRTLRASFKSLHQEEHGTTRLEGKDAQANFTDSYRFEPAAYRLDRELGLGLVPVSVVRKVDGREGAVVLWVEGVITEEERKEQGQPLTPALVRQRRVMKTFDALVFNADRNLGNSLYDLEADRLWLIDHGRCFALNRTLPPAFVSGVARLPRELLERLEGLDIERLQEVLGADVSKQRVKALLARRDAILKKVEGDRRTYGDEVVFGEPPTGDAASEQ